MWRLAAAQKEQVSKCVICHIQLTACRCCNRLLVWRGKNTPKPKQKDPTSTKHKLFYVVGNLLLPPVHQDSCEAANSWITTEVRGILLKSHLLQKEIDSLTPLHVHMKKSWTVPASMAQSHGHTQSWQQSGEQA